MRNPVRLPLTVQGGLVEILHEGEVVGRPQMRLTFAGLEQGFGEIVQRHPFAVR